MDRIPRVAVCVIPLVLVAVVGLRVLRPAVPRIRCSELTHDFGLLDAKVPVECVFTLQNVGRGTLVISDVTASCPCTNLNLSSGELQPGETAELKVEYRAPEAANRFTARICVTSNDPQLNHLFLNLTSVTRQSPRASPSSVDFGTQIFGSESATPPKLRLLGVERQSPQVRVVGHHAPYVRWDLDEDQHGPFLTFRLSERTPIGDLDGCMRVELRQTTLSVPLMGRVVGETTFAPGVVDLTRNHALEVLITGRSPRTRFKIVSAEPSADICRAVHCEWQADAPLAVVHRLGVARGETTRADTAGRVSGTIHITLAGDIAEEILLPVVVLGEDRGHEDRESIERHPPPSTSP